MLTMITFGAILKNKLTKGSDIHKTLQNRIHEAAHA